MMRIVCLLSVFLALFSGTPERQSEENAFVINMMKIRSLTGNICNMFTQSWLRVAKQQVRHSGSVGFSYAGIDSLYAVNGYRYFLFVKNEEGIPFVMKEQADKHPADRIFVPASAFDFLLDESDTFQMYRVVGVEKRENGNLYCLTL